MDTLEEYDTHMLRHQVVHFMAVNAHIILLKCDTKLGRVYGWVDPDEGNTPGPFT